MTPVLFGLFGPIFVILCLVTAINTCNLYTFKPRPGEVKDIHKRYARANNDVQLTDFPGPVNYNRALAGTTKHVTWR